MLRIAFASCSFNRVCPDQPVWDWIRAQRVDRLLLLGDAFYLDLMNGDVHPKDMEVSDFAQHLHRLHSELLAQPQFARLVKSLPAGTVDTIWDDHDFLWDDACGAEVDRVYRDHIRVSTAFRRVLRDALARRLRAGSFPASWQDGAFWNPAEQRLAAPSLPLPEAGAVLHLTDGRSARTRTWLLPEAKRTMFGDVQKAAITAAVTAAPDAVHLFASGSTISGYKRYASDLAWLRGLAAGHRVLVLSGDIHRNEFDAFFTAGPFPLHEATSSGAAVKDAVVFGDPLRNHGVLTLDADSVTVDLFENNVLQEQRTIVRASWLPG